MKIDDLLSFGLITWLVLALELALLSAPLWVGPLIASRRASRIRRPLLYAGVACLVCLSLGYPLFAWSYEFSQRGLVLFRYALEESGASQLLVHLLYLSSTWAWVLLPWLLAIFSFGCSALVYRLWPRRHAERVLTN